MELDNRTLMTIFKCACEGGIRPSKSTNTVVLVVNHIKNRNKAGWRSGVLDFAGSGSKGDQTLSRGLNKSLMRAFENNMPVYLFEVFEQGKYTFRGRVNLASPPFAEEGEDSEGHARKIWVFPLRKHDEASPGH